MTNETRRARLERKRAEATQRVAAYGDLTLAQKYARAVKRGHKATREAKRLLAQIEGR